VGHSQGPLDSHLPRNLQFAIEEISHILGQTTIEMTMVYIGIDRDTTSRATDALDAMHAKRDQLELIH